MSSILDKLSPEERAKALAEAAELLKQEEAREKAERRMYKELASTEVEALFVKAKAACAQMRDVKIEVFNSLQALKESKTQVFDSTGDQKTNTFSTLDGLKKITIGYRDISDWDGTEDAGVQKVQNFIKSLVKDPESALMVEMLTELLKPDKSGKLDPRRITELRNLAEKSGHKELIDGVDIITKAYRMAKSASILRLEERTSTDGKWRNIEQEFSDIEIREAVEKEAE